MKKMRVNGLRTKKFGHQTLIIRQEICHTEDMEKRQFGNVPTLKPIRFVNEVTNHNQSENKLA